MKAHFLIEDAASSGIFVSMRINRCSARHPRPRTRSNSKLTNQTNSTVSLFVVHNVNRLKALNTARIAPLKTDLVTVYKILFSSSFAVDRFSLVQLYDNVYCTRGHNFRLIKQHHTVNCLSNSFLGRTVNAWNSLSASAFDCESVRGFKRFLMIMICRNFYVRKAF